MKNRNGFTLIELLAIIVILGIIGVITVPLILSVIDDAKKNAAIESAYGYKKAINQYYYSKIFADPDYTIQDGEYEISVYKNDGLVVSGNEPSSGWVNVVDAEVTDFSFIIGDYVVTYNAEADSIVAVKGGELALTPTMQLRENAKVTALAIVSGETGSTGISDITEGWVAFIDGTLRAYSVSVTESGKPFIVTDFDVEYEDDNITSNNAVATDGIQVAEKTNAEQLIALYKANIYVKATLIVNSSLESEKAFTVSDMSSVTTNQPDSGWVHFDKVNNNVVVVDYSLTYGTITVNYSEIVDGNYISEFGNLRNKPKVMALGIKVGNVQYYTGGTDIAGEEPDNAIYFDPINGIKDCTTYDESNSDLEYNGTGATGNQTSCLKWFVYSIDDKGTLDKSDDVVNMILDHNTTSTINWTSSSNNYAGPNSSFLGKLASDTAAWTSDKLISPSPFVASWNYSGIKTYTITYTTKARLIEANELARVKGNRTWDYASSSSNITTNNYNFLKGAKGYWTSCPNNMWSQEAWYVETTANLKSNNARLSNFGIRPVISVLRVDVL